jgi:hypothetical protein
MTYFMISTHHQISLGWNGRACYRSLIKDKWVQNFDGETWIRWPLGRHRHRCVDRKEYYGKVWTGLHWLRIGCLRASTKFLVRWNAGNFLTDWGTVSLWRMTLMHVLGHSAWAYPWQKKCVCFLVLPCFIEHRLIFLLSPVALVKGKDWLH